MFGKIEKTFSQPANFPFMDRSCPRVCMYVYYILRISTNELSFEILDVYGFILANLDF